MYRYIRFELSQSVSSYYQIFELELFSGATKLNPVSITASSSYSVEYLPANMIDGNPATSWYSNYLAVQNIYIDIGSTQTLTAYRLSVRTDTYYPKRWVVLGSNDNDIWQKLDQRVNYDWQSDYDQVFDNFTDNAVYTHAPTDYNSLILSYNPTAYYPLTDKNTNKAIDISTNNLHARYNDTSYYDLFLAQSIGSYFDGSLCVSLPVSALFDLSGNNPFTVEFLVGGIQQRTLSGYTYTRDQFIVCLNQHSPYIFFEQNKLGFGYWFNSTNQRKTIIYSDALNSGQMSQVVCVSEPPYYKIYINGQLVISESSAYIPSSPSNTSQRCIGKSSAYNTNDRYTTAFISDVAIWKNRALTAQEILAHHQAAELINYTIPATYQGIDKYGKMNPGENLNSLATRAEPTKPFLDADYHDGGFAKITGYLTAELSPVSRRVRLFDEVSGRLIRQAWSDPNTGYYEFYNIATNRDYLIVANDYNKVYKAVSTDKVKVNE